MQLQYISDNQGHTTGVLLQIPITEWQALKTKYSELEEEERAASSNIPDWQIELGQREFHAIASGTAGLMDWEQAKTQPKR